MTWTTPSINAAHSAACRRAEMIAAIWPAGFPTDIPTSVVVPAPLANVPGLAECRRYTGVPCHVYVPVAHNGITVVLHQGHSGTHESYGLGDACRELVAAGCRVALVVMQGGSDSTSGGTSSHASLTWSDHLTPIARVVNAEALVSGSVYMTGLSGGGWASCVYPALDERIRKVVSVAGWLAVPVPNADREQTDISLYPVGYPDLAAMGATDGRRVVQLLHTTDACCFTQAQYNAGPDYAPVIAAIAGDIGGSFELVWHAQTPHVISAADLTLIKQEFNLSSPPPPPPPPPINGTVIADYDRDGARTGPWTRWTNKGGYLGVIHSAPNNSAATATVTVAGANGTCAVYATWVEYSNRGPTCPITAGGTTWLVDMRVAPVADKIEGGRPFQLLGTVEATGSLEVAVGTANAGGYVIADAILVEW